MVLFLIAIPIEINLDLTEWTNMNENNNDSQHDCLHIASSIESDKYPHQIISYCMGEWPSKWNISENNYDQQFTFYELYKINISSYQLYLWSSPIDIVESYQLYLNQLPISNRTSLSRKIFYNCTLPRFGPLCQYSLDNYTSNHSSLNEVIQDFYLNSGYTSNDKTCYMHLECNLGSTLLCIDWVNICDGYIQCIDGIDEEYCWQMEINQCKENEYRCRNGQCIPSVYLDDNIYGAECLDESDIYMDRTKNPSILYRDNTLIEPTIRREDIMCLDGSRDVGTFNLYCKIGRFMSSVHSMILSKSSLMSDICWEAFKCYINFDNSLNPNCDHICRNETCQTIIEKDCPVMFFMPSVPIAFGHIYLALTKKHVVEQSNSIYMPEYLCYNEKLCGGFKRNENVILFNGTTCRRIQDILPDEVLAEIGFETIQNYIEYMHLFFVKCNTILRNDSNFCNSSSMYQCVNSSKCIAKNRIFDTRRDCDYNDDEKMSQHVFINDVYLNEIPQMHFKCSTINMYISQKLLRDARCHCEDVKYDIFYCDDEDVVSKDIREIISFPTICNSFNDLNPLLIDGQHHTDETECNQWLCNNIYSHCDGYWDCFNGVDEIGCYPSLVSSYNCSSRDHLCISPNASNFMCLSIDKGNNGEATTIRNAKDESVVAFRVHNVDDASLNGDGRIDLATSADREDDDIYTQSQHNIQHKQGNNNLFNQQQQQQQQQQTQRNNNSNNNNHPHHRNTQLFTPTRPQNPTTSTQVTSMSSSQVPSTSPTTSIDGVLKGVYDENVEDVIWFKSYEANGYAFLSNFWPDIPAAAMRAIQPPTLASLPRQHFTFTINNKVYRTVEHWFQSQKFAQLSHHAAAEDIRNQPTALSAKHRNNYWAEQLRSRPFTHDVLAQIMLQGLRAKFTQCQELKSALLDTGNTRLAEIGDQMGKKGGGWDGVDGTLGRLLMQVRHELRG